MTTAATVLDPWVRAMNPQPPAPADVYGQCSINAWLCALIKGQGKVPYEAGMLDPNTGKELRPLTAIEMAVHKLDAQDGDHPLYRQFVAEFGDWADFILPNLHEIGITDLQTLNNAWVQVTFIPTGGTYVNRNGETKDSTTFRFLRVFANEAECRAAASGQAAPATNTTAAAPSGNGNKERETALKFLGPYVKNAVLASGGDIEKTRTALTPVISAQPLLSKYFTVDSPEVVELIAGAL